MEKLYQTALNYMVEHKIEKEQAIKIRMQYDKTHKN